MPMPIAAPQAATFIARVQGRAGQRDAPVPRRHARIARPVPCDDIGPHRDTAQEPAAHFVRANVQSPVAELAVP